MSRESAARKIDASKRAEAAAKVPELDRLIHGRVRLGIVSLLAASESLTFTELREQLRLTDGNLSRHASKLEEAGYIECQKSFQDRKPRSDYRLTAKGRKELERYLSHMERLIEAARGG